MWSGTRSRRPTGARTSSSGRRRLMEQWAAYLAGRQISDCATLGKLAHGDPD